MCSHGGLGGCRVLLVDDERAFLAVMSKRLDKRGFEVACAESGEAALDRVADAIPDVVVLDMRMPGMDGLAALCAIRRAAPGAEVIILTGHADMDAAMAGMRAGAFDYLVKPADIEELTCKIQDAYQRRLLCPASAGA
ncbi:response regulator [Desulfocurvus sp. DL9XJH121]